MKKIIFALLLMMPAVSFAQEEQQSQPLLDALRDCVEKQEKALAEQKILNEGLTEVRSRVRQIDINILGIKNTTQQLVVANGQIGEISKLFNQYSPTVITWVLGLAVFGLVSALFIVFILVTRFLGWASAKK